MTIGDRIRQMDDDELTELLTWGVCTWSVGEVPNCDEGCEHYGCGCANGCPHERRERAVREWLKKEL